MTQAGGLNIPDAAGVGSRLEQELHNIWDTFDLMELKLTQDGFEPMEKPNYNRPTLAPGMLASANGHQITELHEKFGAWHSYAANLLSRIRAATTQVDNEMTVLAIRLRKGALEASKRAGNKKKPTAKEIEDDVKLDPRYQELMLEKQKYDQQRFIMDSHVESLTRELRIISRQVEIRRQDLEANTGGRGYGRPGRVG
jgi:hypothetical protein